MKIGIAHRNIISRDAIGNDILGMYDVLVESGFDVELVGEHFDEETIKRAKTVMLKDAGFGISLLVYHHSILWAAGETLLNQLNVPSLLKYHNVTPPAFFAGYSRDYRTICAAGRAQTARLISLCERKGHCSADSAYNAAELTKAGAAGVAIVPPFTGVAQMIRQARPLPETPYRILFVGRLSPNKGHLAMLTVIAAYIATFGPAINLTMVGGFDDDLAGYKTVVEREIDRLGIRANVTLVNKVDDSTLYRLFMDASAFLCLSEHEGFCVPVIEAQATGVPVVAVGTGALAETIGPEQLVVEPPRSRADYLYIASLLHAACTNDALRRQVVTTGHRNVLTRFTLNAVADRFMGALLPVLERAA